ncbi:hypothetical protein OC846_002627 [Tilletia horrida]|uniref:Uncharacterized protein n=1 Tax=Tilletia horrida TaxID=155126 RepID=A0AAN6JUQ6_9BASI|nr:hypothetical protein OC846_002627 [Tilletia horrida]
MLHRHRSTASFREQTSAQRQYLPQPVGVGESPMPRSRKDDERSFVSSSFPRRSKLSVFVQKSSLGLQSLFRKGALENVQDSLREERDVSYSFDRQRAPVMQAPERPRRKSDSADEILRAPVARNPRPTYAQRMNAYDPAFDQVQNVDVTVHPRFRAYYDRGLDTGLAPAAPIVEHPSMQNAGTRVLGVAAPRSIKRPSHSRLGLLAADCCSATSLDTPKMGKLADEPKHESLLSETVWGKEYVDEIHNLLISERNATAGGLGLHMTAPQGPLHQDSVTSALSVPAGRTALEIAPKTKEDYAANIPMLGARAEPQQSYQYAPSNMTFSPLVSHPSPVSASTPNPQQHDGRYDGARDHFGSPATPEPNPDLLQRRARRPLQLDMFNNPVLDDGSFERNRSLTRLSESKNAPTHSPGAKSIGSIRAPPPFPPPSMPLPALPAADMPLPSPRSYLSTGEIRSVDEGSRPTEQDELAAAGRLRSSSLDAPSASVVQRRNLHHTTKSGLDHHPPRSFLSRLPAPVFVQSGPAVGDQPPQLELSFPNRGTSPLINMSANDMRIYGRSSSDSDSSRRDLILLGSSSIGDSAADPRAAGGRPAWRTPPSRPYEAPSSPSPHRSSMSGRRRSLSYNREPSWSLSSQPSPTQSQADLMSQHERTNSNNTSHTSAQSHRLAGAASMPSASPRLAHEHSASGSGSVSSRDLPMLVSSSQAGSSASFSSFDGPGTPTENMTDRYPLPDLNMHRRAGTIPKISFLGAQEASVNYDQYMRARGPKISGSNLQLGKALPPIAASDTSQPSARSSLNRDDGHSFMTAPRSINNLSPIPGSSPGSHDTDASARFANIHSARSSVAMPAYLMMGLAPSRKSSTNSRVAGGRREEDFDHTSIYGMAM